MSKFKYKCWNVNCEKYGEIQQFDAEQKECPYCHEGGEKEWEKQSSRKLLSWKLILPLILCVVALCYFICPSKQASLELNKHEGTILVGEVDTLCATINDGDSVVWAVTLGDSLVSAVAINNSMCVVKALKEGQQAVVVASLLGCSDVKDSCVYVVKPAEIPQPPIIKDTIDSSITDSTQVIESELTLSLDKTSLTIKVGKSDKLVATVLPSEYASNVVWHSNAPNIAEVSSTGVVIGKAEGKTEVYARVKDKEVKADVTVKGVTPPPPPGLDLGYAMYYGPTIVYSGKRVPHGLGGELKFKRNYEIDLKKASGEKVSVKSGDRMRNCKFDNGRLVQGLIVFSNREQRWITIGS